MCGELFISLREGLDRLGGRPAVSIVAAVYAVDVDRALRLQLEDVLALGGRILFLDAEERALVEYPGERTVEALRAFMAARMETRGDDAL